MTRLRNDVMGAGLMRQGVAQERNQKPFSNPNTSASLKTTGREAGDADRVNPRPDPRASAAQDLRLQHIELQPARTFPAADFLAAPYPEMSRTIMPPRELIVTRDPNALARDLFLEDS